VLSVDLPGHGLSPRDPELTIRAAADAVADTIAPETGVRPELAMGHSLGGLVLAMAVDSGRLTPGRSVYVDAPFRLRGTWDLAEVTAEYEEDRRQRTFEGLRASRPHYSEQDCVVEARAAERFDPATGASPSTRGPVAADPEPGSIIVRADPSDSIDDDAAERHRGRGVQVRNIPGAAHAVWYSHFDEFVAALPEVFG
jgi:pimeloyl-ACP methyl ester carboxylesterase